MIGYHVARHEVSASYRVVRRSVRIVCEPLGQLVADLGYVERGLWGYSRQPGPALTPSDFRTEIRGTLQVSPDVPFMPTSSSPDAHLMPPEVPSADPQMPLGPPIDRLTSPHMPDFTETTEIEGKMCRHVPPNDAV